MEIPKKLIIEIQKKEVKILYKAGYTMDQIAEHMKLSKTTVYFYLKGRKLERLGKRASA